MSKTQTGGYFSPRFWHIRETVGADIRTIPAASLGVGLIELNVGDTELPGPQKLGAQGGAGVSPYRHRFAGFGSGACSGLVE